MNPLRRLSLAPLILPRCCGPFWLASINQLAELPGQVILVLDDYHALSVMAIHETVAFLLEHQPDCVRVVIVTRAEALLPVSRMRARGQLVEIREADLRFTAAESAFFFNGIMGLNLNPTENELLVERTEGWAAGLQMAALALKALPEPSTQTGEFVRNFSSSHRFVLDYLMDEVFLTPPCANAVLLASYRHPGSVLRRPVSSCPWRDRNRRIDIRIDGSRVIDSKPFAPFHHSSGRRTLLVSLSSFVCRITAESPAPGGNPG